MDVNVEVIQDKICVFEESVEIDFDYEFDVAKYFDFTHFETPEEIAEAERWFDIVAGHPPSPFIVKLDTVDDFAESVTSSSRCESGYADSIDNDSGESEVSSTDQGKRGPHLLRSKSMSASQSNLLVSSRLLQPTASLLAKQNQQIGVHSKGVTRRFQKPVNPVKSPGEADATKRQKLEIGYLRKVAQLNHQTSFSHKSSKEVGTTDVNSCYAKTKVTVPKEPDLATANRALRQRSKYAPQLGNDPRYNSSSFRARPLKGKILEAQSSTRAKNIVTTASPQFQDKNSCGKMIANDCGMLELRSANSSKVDQAYSFRARPLNKKIFSSKGDIGVFRNCKKEITVPKEFKLSNSKKLPQNPPTELFSKLSLIPKNHPTSLLEECPLQIKVLKKNASLSNMKENKNTSAITGKSMKCCGDGGRMITDIQNRLTRVRSFTIH